MSAPSPAPEPVVAHDLDAVLVWTLDEPATQDDAERLGPFVLRCAALDVDPAGGTSERSPAAFCAALRPAVAKLRLGRLFAWHGEGEHHRAFSPLHVSGEEMQQWRADFREMAPERQMVAATLIWLYQSGADSTWLRRVPCTWRAGEAVRYMKDAGCLPLWRNLLATYPGW